MQLVSVFSLCVAGLVAVAFTADVASHNRDDTMCNLKNYPEVRENQLFDVVKALRTGKEFDQISPLKELRVACDGQISITVQNLNETKPMMFSARGLSDRVERLYEHCYNKKPQSNADSKNPAFHNFHGDYSVLIAGADDCN